MKINSWIRLGSLVGFVLLLGFPSLHASWQSPSVLSVTERNYLDTYYFRYQVQIGITDGDDFPIYEERTLPVLYRMSDFIIRGEWAPGEVGSWGFGSGDMSFAWSLSEEEGRRPYAADWNPWFDFLYYGFDLEASSPWFSVVTGGLGGFPDRFGLVAEGTIFEDLSGLIYTWEHFPGIGEGPYYGSNLVQAVALFDHLTAAGEELRGEGLLSFSVGFEDDELWTRLVVGERLGIIPEPSVLVLLSLGFLALLRRLTTPVARIRPNPPTPAPRT
jgi:hypothetical protein